MSLLDRFSHDYEENPKKSSDDDKRTLEEKIFHRVMQETDAHDPEPKLVYFEMAFKAVIEGEFSQLPDDKKQEVWNYIHDRIFKK